MHWIRRSQSSLTIKPVGPTCNLRCAYCYYPPVADGLYGGRTPRVERSLTISWQGGEPTLAGLKFFERAVVLQQRYFRAGQTVANGQPTNGTMLDHDWCRFFAACGFLVGISIDGDADDYDHCRVDPRERVTFARVMDGLR